MTKIDRALAHWGKDGPAHQEAVRESGQALPPGTDRNALIGLYASIEARLNTAQGMVVQFVSHTGREGCAGLAHAMAQVACEVTQRRILVLDEAARPDPAGNVTLRDGAVAPQVTKVRGIGLYHAPLRQGADGALPAGAVKQLGAALDGLRPVFDLMLLLPPPMAEDPFARLLARHIDASVLVVEAERTRGADAAALLDQLTLAGGAVAGTVLNRQRQYGPRWLRRWI